MYTSRIMSRMKTLYYITSPNPTNLTIHVQIIKKRERLSFLPRQYGWLKNHPFRVPMTFTYLKQTRWNKIFKKKVGTKPVNGTVEPTLAYGIHFFRSCHELIQFPTPFFVTQCHDSQTFANVDVKVSFVWLADWGLGIYSCTSFVVLMNTRTPRRLVFELTGHWDIDLKFKLLTVFKFPFTAFSLSKYSKIQKYYEKVQNYNCFHFFLSLFSTLSTQSYSKNIVISCMILFWKVTQFNVNTAGGWCSYAM